MLNFIYFFHEVYKEPQPQKAAWNTSRIIINLYNITNLFYISKIILPYFSGYRPPPVFFGQKFCDHQNIGPPFSNSLSGKRFLK